jgi:glyoxylase-like metal-dependent hydrolase (beta-lactamase superfamily II)
MALHSSRNVTIMHIVNVGYDSTNYYVLTAQHSHLLIDVGWPGTLPKLRANLKRKGIALANIQYLLITHYHPDHAGLAQEIKATGVRLLVLEPQLPAIPLLKTYIKPHIPYIDLALHDNLVLSLAESTPFLHKLGIAGTIVSTPGHSDDSISLVLRDGAAFTGDLVRPNSVDESTEALVARSWSTLRALGATRIYPGHGPSYPFV